jgi:polysaccharide biosynthesis/export protein
VRIESGINIGNGVLAVAANEIGAWGGGMVKAIWAVACSGAAAAVFMIAAGGCGSAPVKTTPPVAGAAASASAGGSGEARPPAEEKVVLSGPAYRVGPEDVLHVSVWGNDELTLDVTVRPDGKISVPLIQDVQAEGLTAAELADVIHYRLLAFVREPQVSVILKQVNAPKIFVIGNIARPGTYPLRGDMSVLQALSVAGGFTEFASRRGIKVVRNQGGRQDVRTVNYFEMIDGGRGNYLLRPGDTIVVP